MARRCGLPAAAAPARKLRSWASPARIGVAAVAAVLVAVAAIGALSPSPVVGGANSSPAASSASSGAASSVVGAAWGGAGGLDLIDLVTKGGLVLILLFITLRVLGRMQAAGPGRGGRLNVLESRTLASKASLHLVAVGDRRLVVGLTPSGMVALAELDAAELEDARTEESPADGSDAQAARAPKTATRPIGMALASGQAPFAATLNSLMAPIDGLTDRLAGFFNSGRAR
jgi:flagellar biogenesis protein FliO